MADGLEQQIAKEKLTSKFFQEGERAALQALEKVSQELKAVKQDLQCRNTLVSQLQRDMGVAATVNTNLQRQAQLLQYELGEKVKELTAVKIAAEEGKKALEKDVSAAKSELKRTQEESRMLVSQVTILAECVKANPAIPSFALVPDNLSKEFDVNKWQGKCSALEKELAVQKQEAEHLKYLWNEERMEAQRANVLLLCTQRLLESLSGASANLLYLSSAHEQDDLLRLQQAVHSLTASQLSELIQECSKSRKDVERMQTELSSSAALASSLKAENIDLKKKVESLTEEGKRAQSELIQERGCRMVQEREDKLRMLEQGSVASILMTFFTAPSRCPHCRGGLSDTLGLDLLAEAAGCGSIDELVQLMVCSVATRVSSVYREAFLDQVTVITPPDNIAMADQLLGPVPKGLMFLPPQSIAQFLELTEFVSETQAYALAVQFMTVGPRFNYTQDVVDQVLDPIRFIWLGTAFIENEISRLEHEMLSYRPATGSGAGGDIVAAGRVVPRAAHLALLIPRSLLARLTQALRIRSTALQCRASESLVLPPMFTQDAENNVILIELQRIRRSFAFLPRTVRDLIPQVDPSSQAAARTRRSLPVKTLIELQAMVV